MPEAKLAIGLRVASAVAALGLFLTLFADWVIVSTPGGPAGRTAWAYWSHTDLLLAALAAAAFAGSLVPNALGSRALRTAAAGLAVLGIARALMRYHTGSGAEEGLACALVVLLCVAVELVLEPSQPTAVAPGLAAVQSRWVARPSARFWIVLGTVVLAVITWPIRDFAPHAGVDQSWVMALHMAAHQRLAFGSEIVFTYGPLGFLTVPKLAYPVTALLSLLFALVAYLLVSYAVVRASLRSFGLLALPVAWFILELFAASGADEHLQTAVACAAFIGAIAILRADRTARQWWLVPAVAGAASGIEALVKLNSGFTVALVLGVACVAVAHGRRMQAAAVFAGAAAIVFLICWLAAGQSPAGLPHYASYSWQIISGYVQAQLLETQGLSWQYPAAAGAALVVVGTGWIGTAGWGRSRRMAALVLTAGFLFIWFKEGFVRHDQYHAPLYFEAALGAALAFCLPGTRLRPSATLLPLVPLAVVLVVALAPPWSGLTNPRAFAKSLKDEVLAVASPDAKIVAARQALQQEEDVPPSLLAQMTGQRVHVWPLEASAAWAYGELHWTPLPVFQAYSTYTKKLDQLNSERLRAPDGPNRVLFTSTFYTPTDQPETTVELMCRFVQGVSSPKWAVLLRAGNRCGAPRPLAVVRSETGAPITVPKAPAGAAVTVAIDGLRAGLFERLRTVVFKGYLRELVIDNTFHDRVAPGTTDSATLLNVPVGLDYRPPFNLSQHAKHITVRLVSGADHELRHSFRARFYAIPLRRPAAPR